jgi:hypothetical protein
MRKKVPRKLRPSRSVKNGRGQLHVTREPAKKPEDVETMTQPEPFSEVRRAPSKYPYVGMSSFDNSTVVLFSGTSEGIVLSSDLLGIGAHSNKWMEGNFERFSEDIADVFTFGRQDGYPVLKEFNNSFNHFKVIFTDKREGFVVEDRENHYGVGHYKDFWDEEAFTDCSSNEITLCF